MNIDLLKYATHGKTEDYLDNIFSHGLIPLITKLTTRITDHSATLIDYIYTNKINIKASSGIVISDVSHHFGIFTCINSKLKSQTSQKIKLMRCFNEINQNKFKNILSQIDFEPILQLDTLIIAYTSFMELYISAFDSAFPMKSVRITRKYTKRSPWISSGLLKSSITKMKLSKK